MAKLKDNARETELYAKHLVKQSPSLANNPFNSVGKTINHFGRDILEMSTHWLVGTDVPVYGLDADTDADGDVDLYDFEILAANFQRSSSCYCNGTDLNIDGQINEDDIRLFAAYWLEGTQ